jgi:aryl-alcohol dehydrogenase-like predicted oxidoreductase
VTDAIPLRELGKTGAKVSAIGLGGHHLGDAPVGVAIDVVRAAIDAGVTFFDNCWEYHNGKSEVVLGEALDGRRDKVFLMTKVCTHGRGAALATKMLEESLRRLRTDHLDLWQIHGMGFDDDPERAYAKGGVLEALDAAKRAGKVRFVGFTGHKSPDVHLRMVQLGYPFDAVQMPLNCFDATFRSFEKIVLPELRKRRIACLGMKPLGGTGEAIKRGIVTPQEMLRYAMSAPGVATTITGVESRERLDQALAVARTAAPMTDAERTALRERCAPLAADGRFEIYKMSLKFDNPEAREAHDFPIDPKQKEVRELLDTATGESKR